MKRIITIAALGLCVAACNGTKRSVEAAVRANLNDPDSAKFGDFYYNGKTRRACIIVNSRNEMGGYTGERVVELTNDDRWRVVGENAVMNVNDCRITFADDAALRPVGSSSRDTADE
jgi:hypothetical protein